MAGHIIQVALNLAMGNLTAGLGQAAAQVRSFGQGLADVDAEHHEERIEAVGNAALIMGGSLAAGLGLAAKSAMDFDVQMSELQAVTGASGQALDALRQQAIDAGAATVFSAGEAAQAQVELAKAGVSTADVLGGALTGSLNLAAAGGLDLAEAASIAATTMTTFGLAGSDVTSIADALAAGANKSSADVSDLAAALNQSGLVASQFGMSMEETVGTLSMFSQNALNGSDAGTSFKTMLTRLGAPIGEAKTKMDELGLSMYDGSGQVRDLADVADDLQAALINMTDAERNATLTTIFGSDAIRAANIIYREGGDGVRDWTQQVSDAGYAAELAATKTDNLQGDLDSLSGSIETGLIQSGEHAQGMLRSLVQGLTDVVNGFNAIGPGGQQAMMVIAGIGAAAALLVGGVIKLQAAMSSLGITMAMGPAAGIVLAAGAAVAVLGMTLAKSGREAQDAKARIDSYVSSAGDVIDALGAQRFASSDIAATMKDAGMSFNDFADAISNTDQPFKQFSDNTGTAFSMLEQGERVGSDAFKEVKGDLDEAAASGDKFAIALRDMVNAGTISASQANAIGIEIQQQSNAQQEANRQTEIAAAIDPKSVEGKEQIGAAAQEAARDIDALKDAIDGLINTQFSEQEATTALHREMNTMVEDAKAFVEAGGNMANVMTGTSNEALALQDDLAGLADSNGELIKVWIDSGIAGQELTDRVNFLAQGAYNLAIAQGFPREAAAKLRDTLLSIPSTVSTNVGVPGAVPAILTTADLQARLNVLGGSSAHPEIQAMIDSGSFAAADSALRALTVTRFVQIRATMAFSAAPVLPGGQRLFAAGGINFNAGGRAYEQHSPMIAGASSGTRVWNEPETRGEAYIPFANDWRRSRAQDIWLETGKRIGMIDQTPSGGPSGSGGGGGGGASGAGGMVINFNPTFNIPGYLGDQSQLNRAIAGALKSGEPQMRAAFIDAARRASVK